MIWPEELRVDPIAAAARAGAIEQAVAIRTRQALERGDAPAVKCFTSAWQDVVKCLSVLEELAKMRIRELPERIQLRREISGNLDDLAVSPGPAWIRANMPSVSEAQESCTLPATEEEIERWNRRIEELERERSDKATAVTPPRQPGPCEREILANNSEALAREH
jgi:hypothetical protein